jgi:hypothetical protein
MNEKGRTLGVGSGALLALFSYKLSADGLTIDYPANAKPIHEDAKALCPKRLRQRHRDLSALGKRTKNTLSVNCAGNLQR